jgi:hypothetical protein
MNLVLQIALGMLPAPESLARAEYAAHLQAWSLPALAALVAAGAGATGWSALALTGTPPAVGQLWEQTSRAIRGMTIRITAVTPGKPGHVVAVIETPPHAALHDTTGREMDLAAGRTGLRGFRLVGAERSATR